MPPDFVSAPADASVSVPPSCAEGCAGERVRAVQHHGAAVLDRMAYGIAVEGHGSFVDNRSQAAQRRAAGERQAAASDDVLVLPAPVDNEPPVC